MNALIFTSANKQLESTTGKPVFLTDICGKTLMERCVQRLIAAGIEKAFVVSDSREVSEAVQYYENSDKISLKCLCTVVTEPSSDGLWLVCDACSCYDLDIRSALKEIPKDKLRGTAFRASADNELVMCIIDDSNVKLIDFTSSNNVSKALSRCLTSEVIADVELPRIGSASDIIACQERMLYKIPGLVTKLTDSNFNGVTLIPPVYIGRNVAISPGAIIEKGSVIADDARVCEGARVSGSYVGEYAVVGKNCTLNKTFLARDSVLMNRVRAASGCVIGYKTGVKANTTLVENTFVCAENDRSANIFSRGMKHLEFDDDGICSLSEASADVTAYVELGKAVGTALPLGSTVIVGCGSFKSSQTLCDAVCCGVVSTGANAIDIGECSLSQLAFAMGSSSAQIGIYTALDKNGDVRLIQQGGLPLLTSLERCICRCFDNKSFRSAATACMGDHLHSQESLIEYYNYLSQLLPASLYGINACVRTSDSVTAMLCDKLFKPANDIDGERIVFQLSSDLSSVCAFSPLTGNVHWERLCLLGCKILFEANKPVCVPYSLPSSVDELAAKYQGTLMRYCTVNVDDTDTKARETAALPYNFFVRDGLLLSVMICRYLNEQRITLKQALEDIKPLFTTQRYICSHKRSFVELQKLENSVAVGSEGFEVSDERSRAFIRPSKNKQAVMIFAESVNSEFAVEFCDNLIERIRNYELFGHE